MLRRLSNGVGFDLIRFDLIRSDYWNKTTTNNKKTERKRKVEEKESALGADTSIDSTQFHSI